jgi:predicted outer membrane protein
MASTRKTLRWTGALALAMLSVGAWAAAQQNPARPALPRAVQPGGQQVQQPQQGQQPQRVTANRLNPDGAMSHDQLIANWVLTANQAEIAIAKAAEDKLDNKDVRKFAELLIKEHMPMTQELERFGATPVRFDEGSRRDQSGRTERTAVGAAPRAMNMTEVHREIAQRCVNTAEKELSEAKGKERDECFLGMQIGAHHEMINSQKVLRDYASPELRAVLDKSIQTAESHLDQAKQLIRDLANRDDRKSDSQDEK